MVNYLLKVNFGDSKTFYLKQVNLEEMFAGREQYSKFTVKPLEYLTKLRLLPASIYLFKSNNRNTRKSYGIC